MKNIHCTVFGHEFGLFDKITNHVNEYRCKNCKQQFTTNSNGALVELTPKFKEINSVLKHIYLKRKNRKTAILNR